MNKNINFTKDELSMLSNGVIALINNACEARKLVSNYNTYAAIDAEIEQLIALNSKVCGMEN